MKHQLCRERAPNIQPRTPTDIWQRIADKQGAVRMMREAIEDLKKDINKLEKRYAAMTN